MAYFLVYTDLVFRLNAIRGYEVGQFICSVLPTFKHCRQYR